MWDTILIFLLGGAGIGFISGFLRGGIGIFIVTALTWLLPLLSVKPDASMHIAVGTSLAIALPITLFYTYRQYQQNYVDTNYLRGIIGALIIGVGCGIYIAHTSSIFLMKWIFLLFVLASAIYIPFHAKIKVGDQPPDSWPLSIMILTISIIATIVGEGVGILLIPILIGCSYSAEKSIGLGSAVNSIALLMGTLGYLIIGLDTIGISFLEVGYINLFAFFWMVIPLSLFFPLGLIASKYLPEKLLRSLLTFAMLLVAASMIYQLTLLYAA